MSPYQLPDLLDSIPIPAPMLPHFSPSPCNLTAPLPNLGLSVQTFQILSPTPGSYLQIQISVERHLPFPILIFIFFYPFTPSARLLVLVASSPPPHTDAFTPPPPTGHFPFHLWPEGCHGESRTPHRAEKIQGCQVAYEILSKASFINNLEKFLACPSSSKKTLLRAGMWLYGEQHSSLLTPARLWEGAEEMFFVADVDTLQRQHLITGHPSRIVGP